MKQVIILLLAVLTFALTQNASDSNIDFKSWKNKHKKDYKLKGKAYGVNETQAEKNFKANADRVRKHNSNKNVTYKQSLNENADLTDSDVTQRFTGLIPQAEDKNVKSSAYSVSSTNDVNLKALPVSLDYTSQMSPIKNQLSCGSCWAFSTTAVIEWYLKKNGSNVILSEQSLVDCCSTNKGCNGGNMLSSFTCAKNTGIATQAKYPYVAVTQQCQTKKFVPPIYKIPKAMSFTNSGREDLLMSYLKTYGPLAVIISAGGTGLPYYSSGVFYDAKCSSSISKADHAVVLVGYGNDPALGDYWILRNSWGTSWGMSGYFRLARNKKNHCGVANLISYAVYPA